MQLQLNFEALLWNVLLQVHKLITYTTYLLVCEPVLSNLHRFITAPNKPLRASATWHGKGSQQRCKRARRGKICHNGTMATASKKTGSSNGVVFTPTWSPLAGSRHNLGNHIQDIRRLDQVTCEVDEVQVWWQEGEVELEVGPHVSKWATWRGSNQVAWADGRAWLRRGHASDETRQLQAQTGTASTSYRDLSKCQGCRCSYKLSQTTFACLNWEGFSYSLTR